MADMTIKQGDTFKRRARYVRDGENAELPEETEIRAQVRKDVDGSLLSTLDVTIEDQEENPGYFTIEKAYDAEDGTALWPVGVHLCDIEYTFEDRRTSSRTFTIEVQADVSHD